METPGHLKKKIVLFINFFFGFNFGLNAEASMQGYFKTFFHLFAAAGPQTLKLWLPELFVNHE